MGQGFAGLGQGVLGRGDRGLVMFAENKET